MKQSHALAWILIPSALVIALAGGGAYWWYIHQEKIPPITFTARLAHDVTPHTVIFESKGYLVTGNNLGLDFGDGTKIDTLAGPECPPGTTKPGPTKYDCNLISEAGMRHDYAAPGIYTATLFYFGKPAASVTIRVPEDRQEQAVLPPFTFSGPLTTSYTDTKYGIMFLYPNNWETYSYLGGSQNNAPLQVQSPGLVPRKKGGVTHEIVIVIDDPELLSSLFSAMGVTSFEQYYEMLKKQYSTSGGTMSLVTVGGNQAIQYIYPAPYNESFLLIPHGQYMFTFMFQLENYDNALRQRIQDEFMSSFSFTN